MTGHPSLLAPPPPLANLPQDAPIETPIETPPLEHAAISAENATASLKPGVTDTGDASADQAAEVKLTEAQQTGSTDNAVTPKQKFEDFLTQVHALTHGPNYEMAKPDFTAFGEELVRGKVLPAFAIADNTHAPLKLALNTGQEKTQYMLNLFRDQYFLHKA